MLVAVLALASPASAGRASTFSFLVPVGNVSLPASLADGSIGGLAADASGNVYVGVTKGFFATSPSSTRVAPSSASGRRTRIRCCA